MMDFTIILSKCMANIKKKKIPFILFVNTREVGAFNYYMSWDQIIELHSYEVCRNRKS